MGEAHSRERKREQYLSELKALLSDEIHLRLIGAYEGNDPLAAMESELSLILAEVIELEDNQDHRQGISGV